MIVSCFQQELHRAEQQLQARSLSLSSAAFFINLLQDCIARKDLSEGERTYSLIVKNGLQGNSYLACLLMRMVSTCGLLQRACCVFLDMGDQHNSHSWTFIIHAHVQHLHHQQALTYYAHMLLSSSIKEITPMFVEVLKACDHTYNLEKGMLIHVAIAGRGLDENLHVQSAMLSMYANCGCLQDAYGLFNRWQIKDHAIWSVMIKGFLQHNQLHKAYELVEEMQNQGLQPNKAALLVLVDALSNTNTMIGKVRFYSYIVILGLDIDTHINSSILKMYFKCHRLEEAFHVFKSLSLDGDVVSWNVMIAGLADHGHYVDALQLFKTMKLEKMNPSEATFVSLLKCIESEDEGRFAHMDVVMLGLDSNVRIQNSLINMYAKVFCLMDGRNLLDRISGHDIISWSSMMSGYVDQGQNMQAFQLFVSMLHKGVEPNAYTFSCLLQATETLQVGYLIHADIFEQALESSPFIRSNAISMYCKCGSLGCAQTTFDSLVAKDGILFSTLISGYAENGHEGRALELFCKSWQELGKLESVTVLCALKACTLTFSSTNVALIFSAIVEQGLDEEIKIGSALVNSFAELGSPKDSTKVFETLHTHDVVTYSALISGIVEHGHPEMALQLGFTMQIEGLKPDAITWVCMLRACSSLGSIKQGQLIHADVVKQGCELNAHIGSALINLYSCLGKAGDARKVFDGLHSQDVVVWSTIISCYVEHESNEEAIELYKEMQKVVKPNIITFLWVLKACAQLPYLHIGMVVHGDVCREGLEGDPSVRNALVNMYCKCGNLTDAIDVLEDLKDQDSVLWSTLIVGCAGHGLSELVHCHFTSSEDTAVLLDAGLFACLLRACSHGGLIKEGLHLLLQDNNFGLMFEHLLCLVDMLGRTGCVEEAGEVALTMPFQPSPVFWVLILGSCLTHSNVDLARKYITFMDELECKDVMVGYTLMQNVYASQAT